MKNLSALTFLMIMTTLLSGCKSKQAESNPLLETWSTPFGVPPFDKIKTEHFKPAVEAGIRLHEAQIDSIVKNTETPSFGNVIEALDRSGEVLNNAYTVFSLLNSAESNDRMQADDMEISPLVSAHNDNIYLNDRLFQKVKAVYDQREYLSLDPQQLRLTEQTYKRFVRAGALLTPAQKEQLKKINEQLSRLGVQFGNNLLADNNAFTLVIDKQEDLAGVPASIQSAASTEAVNRKMEGKWVFTLSKPSMIPFLSYSERRDLREKLYKASLERCNRGDSTDNKQIVNEIAKLRLEKARLMGYPSYGAFALDDEMAQTPENAYALLDKLWQPSLELAKKELEEMKAIKKAETGDDSFESWDWWYYAEKLRKQNYALDEEMLRPYFSLENVQGGIFYLANRLYGITFQPIVVPLYHPDAVAYEVLDADGSHLGVLYFDYFPRDGKSQGAWCGNYVEQTYKDGKRVAPVVSVVCNFTRPVRNTPALLTLDETETLFHEFGHALHFLFHDVKYRGLSEVEGDFVELPSQVMENWAFEPEMLKHYAVHYRTGEVIPKYLVDKLRKSELFNQGFATTELIAASLSDMDIHSVTEYEPFDPMAFERQALNEKRGLIPQIEPRYRYPYFSHIFDGGYSAGYYFYTWAEVLDKDTFEAFRESGDLFNKKIAADFRAKLLSRGGSEDGMSLYRAFRGADPDKRAMLRSRGLWDEPEPEPEPDDEGEAPLQPEVRQE